MSRRGVQWAVTTRLAAQRSGNSGRLTSCALVAVAATATSASSKNTLVARMVGECFPRCWFVGDGRMNREEETKGAGLTGGDWRTSKVSHQRTRRHSRQSTRMHSSCERVSQFADELFKPAVNTVCR